MSNKLSNTGITYFQVPNSCMTEERYKALNKTQIHLYLFFWKEVQRNSTLTLKYSGVDLAEKTWMTETQVFAAREGLKKLGLLQFEKIAVGTHKGKYEYSLTDPDTERCISDPTLQSKGFDFAKLTPAENEAYYLKRLNEMNVSSIQHTGNGLKTSCPLCKGEKPTLEVKIADGKFWCHKCQTKGRHTHFEQALALTLGLEITAKEARKRVAEGLRHLGISGVTTGEPEAVYSYTDGDGVVVFEVCRFPSNSANQKNIKRRKLNRRGDYEYRQTKDLPNLLYRLPDVMEADTVIICEGEKDADAVHKLTILDDADRQIVGSTNSGGANKWKKEHTQALTGKRVICVGDNDERGVRHMDDVVSALAGIASEVVRVHIPMPYKDVSEYLAACGQIDFRKLLPEAWTEILVSI